MTDSNRVEEVRKMLWDKYSIEYDLDFIKVFDSFYSARFERAVGKDEDIEKVQAGMRFLAENRNKVRAEIRKRWYE